MVLWCTAFEKTMAFSYYSFVHGFYWFAQDLVKCRQVWSERDSFSRKWLTATSLYPFLEMFLVLEISSWQSFVSMLFQISCLTGIIVIKLAKCSLIICCYCSQGGMQGSPETPQNITVSKLEQNLAFIAMLIRLLK